MSSSDSSQVMPMISNRRFLEAIFGERWREAQVVYFLGDPDNQPKGSWQRHNAGDVIEMLDARHNNYFEVSLPDGTPGVLVFDDVGIKVDRRALERIMGPPSYVLETSPGSYQVGYLLDPAADQALMAARRRTLHKVLGGDNLKNPRALMRLPSGANGKLKYRPGGDQ
jgi:hypothetical protein